MSLESIKVGLASRIRPQRSNVPRGHTVAEMTSYDRIAAGLDRMQLPDSPDVGLMWQLENLIANEPGSPLFDGRVDQLAQLKAKHNMGGE